MPIAQVQQSPLTSMSGIIKISLLAQVQLSESDLDPTIAYRYGNVK
jgi:hypothetical protein